MEKYANFLEKMGNHAPAWSEQDESVVLEPYTYMDSNPGKEIRPVMMDAFNDWLQVPKEQLDLIARIVQMLHNASLLVDDVEDDSQLRRGIPVAHKIFGIPQTINTANYVYFLAYKQLFALRDDANASVRLDEIVNEEFLNLHRGQGLEIYWRDSLTCPTEEQYINMVSNKTGGLLRMAVKLMMAKSKSDMDCVPLVNLIGIYFQIRDDYMNLYATEYTKNKGFAEDLSEGKFSFPVVHSIRTDKDNRQVLNVLQKRPSTPTTKRYVIDYMKTKTKSFEYTWEVLDTLEKQARDEIARLGGNRKLEALIDRLKVSPPE